MTKLGERLLKSAKEARAIARGEAAPARAFVPPSIDVAAIRKRAGLSQARFAQQFGLSATAVREWEQRRRSPDPAARVLLMIIDREPEAVKRALDPARTTPAAPRSSRATRRVDQTLAPQAP